MRRREEEHADRIEAHLQPHQLRTFHELTRLLCGPHDRWRQLSPLRGVMQMLAWVQLADELWREGATREAAEDQAAISLGLNPGTMARTLERWRAALNKVPDNLSAVPEGEAA